MEQIEQTLEKLNLILNNLVKRNENIEFKLLEKEEEIKSLSLNISTLKAQSEQKDLEIEKLFKELQTYKNGINDIYNSYKKYEQEENQ